MARASILPTGQSAYVWFECFIWINSVGIPR